MAESIAKTYYPALLSKLEKRKQAARNVPLSIANITTLLSLRFNNKPLYESIDQFYSEEYRKAITSGTTPTGESEIARYRQPTEEEINLLYCDIHAREDHINYSGNNQPDS
jgi:hypothetical protein